MKLSLVSLCMLSFSIIFIFWVSKRLLLDKISFGIKLSEKKFDIIPLQIDLNYLKNIKGDLLITLRIIIFLLNFS